MRPIAPSCKGKAGLRRFFSLASSRAIRTVGKRKRSLLFLEKLFEEIARLDALAIAAAEQALERLLDVFRLDVLADLFHRFDDLLLALDAELGLVPRPFDAHGDLNAAEVDGDALAAGACLDFRGHRVIEAARSKVDAARP